MGNSASHDEDEDDYAEQFDGIETLGYRVLGVQPNSPASKAGLVSFFDFIVGANQQMLLGSGEGLEEGEEYDDVDFPALLRENIGQPVELLVWNIKAQEKRVVQLIPRDDWGGAGLLGVTIKLDDYGGADERLVRVLEVEEHSPAAVAGLIPEQDFLLGTTACALQSADVLAEVLMENVDRVVELYVYNSTSDMVRVVGLLPTYSWGDHNSLLGAEVGTGYLHRLPTNCRNTIGQSVERRVQVLNQNDEEGNLNQETIQMEHHLEMEVDEDDSEVGAEESIRQPHQLGRLERDIMGRSIEAQESMRSISLASEAGGEPIPMHARSEHNQEPPMPTAASTDESKEGVGHDDKVDNLTEQMREAGLSTTEGEVGQSSQESVSMPPFPEAAPVRHDPTDSESIATPPPPPVRTTAEPSSLIHPPPPPPQDSAPMLPPQADEVAAPLPPPLPADEDDEHTGKDDKEPEEEEESEEEESDDEEYETDSEEEDGDEAPRSGGFLSSFMPAPPKMQY